MGFSDWLSSGQVPTSGPINYDQRGGDKEKHITLEVGPVQQWTSSTPGNIDFRIKFKGVPLRNENHHQQQWQGTKQRVRQNTWGEQRLDPSQRGSESGPRA